MVFEGDRHEQGKQTDRCPGPCVKRDPHPCPGHQNLMVKQLRSASEIAGISLHFSARGIVSQRDGLLAETDVLTHGIHARCAAPCR